VLREEYLKPLGMSARALAIGIPPNRLTEIVPSASAGTSAPTPRFWIDLQVAHDLSKADADTDYSGIPTRAA
jgi:plasmid maintenance system antidote protein VapI